MAEDVTVSEETLTSSVSQLVSSTKVLLQKAKQEAEGRTDSEERCDARDTSFKLSVF